MAISKIRDLGGYKSSLLTCPIENATLSYNTCWTSNNTVNIGLQITNIDVSANGHVATVPEGYRPPEIAARGMGAAYIGSQYVPVFVNIGTNGKVNISHTSSHMTEFRFAASYGI